MGPLSLSTTKNRTAALVSVACTFDCVGRDDLSASLILNSPASLGLRLRGAGEPPPSLVLAASPPLPVAGVESPACEPPHANRPIVMVVMRSRFMGLLTRTHRRSRSLPRSYRLDRL